MMSIQIYLQHFDLQVLQILVSLMLAQARECLYEKLQLQIENFTIKDTTHVKLK